MEKFLISERYRLELHWDKVGIAEEGLSVLRDAYFSGPALKQALKLTAPDSIKLDFCKQYSILVDNFYVADLNWYMVEYKNDIIYLGNPVLKYQLVVDKAATLKDNDYLVIDTADHELVKHRFNMLYTTYIVNNDDELMDYRNK